MMHTLRNRKTGRKNALRRFTEVRHRSQTAVYPHLAGAIRHSNSNFQALWASKPECDAHICLYLGFTPQNFRLSQVSLCVCYFWLSFFRMDEGNPCQVSTGPAGVRWFKSNPYNQSHSALGSYEYSATIRIGKRVSRTPVGQVKDREFVV
jgi:hypothetical protein